MKTSVLAGSFVVALAVLGTPLQAQRVSAEAGVRRVVAVKRYAPRVIVVERTRHQHGRHWKRKGYRPVVVYYINGRYYDRIERRHPGVRAIVVYEREGRYYRDD